MRNETQMRILHFGKLQWRQSSSTLSSSTYASCWLALFRGTRPARADERWADGPEEAEGWVYGEVALR